MCISSVMAGKLFESDERVGMTTITISIFVNEMKEGKYCCNVKEKESLMNLRVIGSGEKKWYVRTCL